MKKKKGGGALGEEKDGEMVRTVLDLIEGGRDYPTLFVGLKERTPKNGFLKGKKPGIRRGKDLKKGENRREGK